MEQNIGTITKTTAIDVSDTYRNYLVSIDDICDAVIKKLESCVETNIDAHAFFGNVLKYYELRHQNAKAMFDIQMIDADTYGEFLAVEHDDFEETLAILNGYMERFDVYRKEETNEQSDEAVVQGGSEA